jgi:hypothetical protein
MGSGAGVRALLVCPEGSRPADAPGWVHVLHPGRIENGLAGIR